MAKKKVKPETDHGYDSCIVMTDTSLCSDENYSFNDKQNIDQLLDHMIAKGINKVAVYKLVSIARRSDVIDVTSAK
ncbi:MAG: hypothetical protein V3V96_16450 [Acidiferrobacterales bacterium]